MAPAHPASWFAQRVIIGVGDMAVSDTDQIVLSTYALGSCVGVAAYDPIRKAGGILHLMLPDSQLAPAKAAAQPAMFADTGLKEFFHHLSLFRTDPGRLQICVAGGSSIVQGEDPFRIAERNIEATLGYFSTQGRNIGWSDLGGSSNRTLHLELASGRLTLISPGNERHVDLRSELS